MPLESPNLDDRTWDQLVQQCMDRIDQTGTTWTDRGPSDPGRVLIELFAFLTDTMIYRINRLPEKAYVEFLRLLGVVIEPPAAATVTLRFSLVGKAERAIEVPRNTRVTTSRSSGDTEAAVFQTLSDVRIEPDQGHAEVDAIHAELVEGELLGRANGRPGATFTLRRAPVVAPTDDPLDLRVGVRLGEGEDAPPHEVIEWQGVRYRQWREVEHFASLDHPAPVYTADRAAGTISFAPTVQLRDGGGRLSPESSALGLVPAPGREIRCWYRRGGGASGNVAAHQLSVLRDPLPGVVVDNPAPATGGRDAETVANATKRGPLELRSLQRAVTARDYELAVLQSSGAINRVCAFTKLDVWSHATPGTVAILLVPAPPAGHRMGQPIGPADLAQQESAVALQRAGALLDKRRPLGTRCELNWVRYKTVRVRARVVVPRDKNPRTIRDGVVARLQRSINPIEYDADVSGWPFGQTLHVSHVYDLCLSEPGVSYVDRVDLFVDDDFEGKVNSIAADQHQPGTWYAANGARVFRSLNDGEGWEPAGRFGGGESPEEIHLVVTSTSVPGLLAGIGRQGDTWRIHLSHDCGETWTNPANLAFRIQDADWVQREDATYLLLATDEGLLQLADAEGAVPELVAGLPGGQSLPACYAVSVSRPTQGVESVAVAAQKSGGVYLSRAEGKVGTFTKIGGDGKNIQTLAFQTAGTLTWLWAGIRAPGEGAGEGCLRWEIGITEDAPAKEVRAFASGWDFSSCLALTFVGTTVFAATFRGGIVSLDGRETSAAWRRPPSPQGLPIREDKGLAPLYSIAAMGNRLMAGADAATVRSLDEGASFELHRAGETRHKITLPRTWLFCSGEHDIEVVPEELERLGSS